VQPVADPGIRRGIHELVAEGAFGRLVVRLENAPLPDKPKTSWLVVLSIERELRRVLDLDDLTKRFASAARVLGARRLPGTAPRCPLGPFPVDGGIRGGID